MATIPKVITYEEWLRMPVFEDGIEEVVDGEIIQMPPPKWKHAEIVENLANALKVHLSRESWKVVITRFGLVIRMDPLTSREPDLAVFRTDAIIERDGYIHSAPELIAEVLSPANTRRERQRKLDDYGSLGVPEVWVVSPEARTVEVLQLKKGKLRTVQIVAEGVLRPVRFPDAAVDVSSIWPD